MKQTGILLIILVIIAIVILLLQWAFLSEGITDQTPSSNDTSQVTACTMDAKVCPDGTYVGRVAPSCEFALCPSTSPVYEVSIGQQFGMGKITIVPLEVLEDSRCPVNTTCVWAGQVRVRIRTAHDATTTEQIIISNTPLQIASSTVTLTAVTPLKEVNKHIVPSNYRLSFEIRN